MPGPCTIAVKNELLTITCHTCGKTSYNKYDVKYKYCGFCHKFHFPRVENAETKT